MVRIGIVGLGFMGMIHYLAARKLKGAKVVGLCSRDKKKLSGDWRGIRGNFGPPGEVMDLTGVKTFERVEGKPHALRRGFSPSDGSLPSARAPINLCVVLTERAREFASFKRDPGRDPMGRARGPE